MPYEHDAFFEYFSEEEIAEIYELIQESIIETSKLIGALTVIDALLSDEVGIPDVDDPRNFN